MKILTASQMREIDRQAIENLGIPGLVLMENAGREVASLLSNELKIGPGCPVLVIAGKGNNGGDGLVAARHLFNYGVDCEVLLVSREEEVKGDALVNLQIAKKTGIKIKAVPTPALWRRYRPLLKEAPVVIDALFGTGLSSPLSGLYAQVINDLNNSGDLIVAVDIPSGLSADSFELIGPAVKADFTVTMAAPKIAHIFPPAEDYTGELYVADISVPPFLFNRPDFSIELVEIDSLQPYFQPREKGTHKGSYGHLLILAGSYGKTGAAAMAGKAALKMGAGLVTVATADSCLPVVAKTMPELMTEPLPETSARTISERALSRVLELLEGKDALLLGPGLSTHSETSSLVLNLLERIKKTKLPVIIDADGLNIISSRREILSSLPAKTVLTPHPGEFSRLSGIPTGEALRHRLEVGPEFAAKYHLHLVFKGYKSLTVSPQGKIWVNPTGNPGMASGGSGDVLSGFIASEAMQTKDLTQAVVNAVFVHGLSGDLAADKIGERPLLATDLIRYLPSAISFVARRGEDNED
ncbi:MAG TPA: bifunctional ADP-dependent NAD(P)H-hydrate dehydratase/NAD(P)H-hydrate epimerase [Acidobacteria bacterium]|nr:bifunctional ADP-dependent NAD(P)H-hydrate dehydratase/NAD(P)H-hydrate epimerase [Acidobacteriota bacterium]